MFLREMRQCPEPTCFPALHVPTFPPTGGHICPGTGQGTQRLWPRAVRGRGREEGARGRRGGPGVRSVGRHLAALGLHWETLPSGDTSCLGHADAPELSLLCFIVVNTGNRLWHRSVSKGPCVAPSTQSHCGVAAITSPELFTFPNKSSMGLPSLRGPQPWKAAGREAAPCYTGLSETEMAAGHPTVPWKARGSWALGGQTGIG